MRITKHLFPLACAVLAAAIPFSSARAEDFAGDVPDRVWIDLGGQINELTTNAGVTGKAGVGTQVDFEQVFDLPGSKTTFQTQGTVRVSEHRRWVDFGYVKIDRSGSHVIPEDVNFGDYTFHSGGQVDASFGTEFIYGAFRYDFLHEDKIRISGSAGLSWTNLSTSLTGHGNVTGPNGPIAGNFESSASVGIPVPLVGLNLDWALTRRLVLRGYSRLFRINAAGVNGGFYENGLHLNWYFVKYFGLGLGVDKIELRVKKAELSDNRVAKFDYSVSGIGLYANLAF